MTTPDPRADLAARLRQALTAEDAEHAVEIIVGAGWRPAGDVRRECAEELLAHGSEATRYWLPDLARPDDPAQIRARLDTDRRRWCAADLRRWLDSRPVVVRVDGVDYLSVASVRAFADEAGP